MLNLPEETKGLKTTYKVLTGETNPADIETNCSNRNVELG